MDPNNPHALMFHAMTLNIPLPFVGRHVEALSLIEQAIRINPKPPSWVWHELGKANVELKRYEKAIGAFKKALRVASNDFFSFMFLAVCYVATDHMAEAKKAAEEMLRIQPSFSIDNVKEIAPKIEETESGIFVLESLRKAGIPEHSPSQ